MIGFEHPQALLLLLLIPAFYALRAAGIFAPGTFPLTLSDWNGASFEWKSPVSRFLRFFSSACFFCAYLALVLALSSPSASRQEKVYTSKGAEVVFLVDISPSMAALDMDGLSRLTAAKQTIASSVSALPGTAFALAALAEEAAMLVPPTLDHVFLLERLASLAVGELGDGTALGTGISTVVYHLAASRAPKKALILLTDGENNAGIIHPLTAAQLAAENGITLFVAGLGSRGKTALEYADPVTGKIYSGYFDSSYDVAPLKRLAAQGNGAFFTAENTFQLAEVINGISKNQTVEQSYNIRTVEIRYYAHAVSAAICLFAAAWFVRRLCMRELP